MAERDLPGNLETWFTPKEIDILRNSSVILMAGFPGCGKSVVSSAIVSNLGGVKLRSDEIREQVFPDSALLEKDSSLYPYKSAIVYSIMRNLMLKIANDGGRAVVDATHMNNLRFDNIRALDEGGMLSNSVLIIVEADEDAIRERQKNRPGAPGTGETWEDGWIRVYNWFKEMVHSGEYTEPGDNEGIMVIRVHN